MSEEKTTYDAIKDVERISACCDGWADLWAVEQGIRSQIERMLGDHADQRAVELLLKWSKQTYSEGCYFGYREAVKNVIGPFIEDFDLYLTLPDWDSRDTAPKDRPIQTWDGECQAVVEWDERCGFFAFAHNIVVPDPHETGANHRVEWDFTHWHDLQEPPK